MANMNLDADITIDIQGDDFELISNGSENENEKGNENTDNENGIQTQDLMDDPEINGNDGNFDDLTVKKKRKDGAISKYAVMNQSKVRRSRMIQKILQEKVRNGTIKRSHLLECQNARRFKGGKTWRYKGYNFNFVQAYNNHITIKCTMGMYVFFVIFCLFFFFFFLSFISVGCAGMHSVKV